MKSNQGKKQPKKQSGSQSQEAQQSQRFNDVVDCALQAYVGSDAIVRDTDHKFKLTTEVLADIVNGNYTIPSPEDPEEELLVEAEDVVLLLIFLEECPFYTLADICEIILKRTIREEDIMPIEVSEGCSFIEIKGGTRLVINNDTFETTIFDHLNPDRGYYLLSDGRILSGVLDYCRLNGIVTPILGEDIADFGIVSK